MNLSYGISLQMIDGKKKIYMEGISLRKNLFFYHHYIKHMWVMNLIKNKHLLLQSLVKYGSFINHKITLHIDGLLLDLKQLAYRTTQVNFKPQN